MGEAKRRRQAGDTTYSMRKDDRDLNERRNARKLEKMEQRQTYAGAHDFSIPGKEGRKQAETLERKSPVVEMLGKKECKPSGPKLGRAERRRSARRSGND